MHRRPYNTVLTPTYPWKDVAWAAIRTKGTCFGAPFRRLARRQGPAKALVAVAHRLLEVIYVLLRDQQPYRELGAD